MKENKNDYTFILILIIIFAFILRYYKANTADLWVDEAFSYYLSLQNFTGILKYLYIFDAHPPLFYFFLHFWVKLGQNPLFLRMPGILIGSFSIFGVYLLGRELLNKEAALIAASFTAVSASHVYMCREIRMYVYLSFFVIFGFYFFVKLFDKDQKEIESKQGTGFGVVFKGQTPQNLRSKLRGIRPDEGLDNPGACPLGEQLVLSLPKDSSPENEQHVGSALTALPQGRGHRAPTPFTAYLYWFLYTLCMVISWYLHYFGIIVTLSQNIIVLCFFRRINIKYWFYSQAAVLICYGLWFKYLFHHIFTSRGPVEAGFAWKQIFIMFDYFFTSIFVAYPLKCGAVYIIFIFCAAMLVEALLNNRKNKFFIAVAFLGFYAQFIILYFKSIFSGNSIFQLRYFYYILPLYFIILTGSFFNKEKIKISVAIMVISLFLFFNFTAIYNMYNVKEFTMQRWNESIDYLEKYYQKKDGIIIQNSFQAFAFNYYFKNKHKEYYIRKDNILRDVRIASQKHKRIWLVTSFVYYEDPDGLTIKGLMNNYKFIMAKKFPNYIQPDADIVVMLFERKK